VRIDRVEDAMLGNEWVGLLQRIPATYHNTLALCLSTGAELVLQNIVQLGPEFMVIRGRTAGCTDAGRVFVVPYGQIQYLGFQNRMTEAELQGIFGADSVSPGPAAPAVPEPAAAVPVPAAPAAAPEAAAAPPPEPAPRKPAPVSKSILLARLRARLGQDGKQTER
jgi:hypothetical protein